MEVSFGPRSFERLEWAFFAPFVIEAGPLRGRPPRDLRRTLDAIFYTARTGASWQELLEELGNWNSVHRQYRLWTTSGLRDVLLEALADGGGSDAIQMVDSTSIRAHHRAAGARGGLRTRLLAARAVDSRPKSTPGPTLRVFQSR
jgi:transposase